MPETSTLTKVTLVDDASNVHLHLSVADPSKIDARRQVRMIVDVNDDGKIQLAELAASVVLVSEHDTPYTKADLGRGQRLRGNFAVLRISVAWTVSSAPPAEVVFAASLTQGNTRLKSATLPAEDYELTIPIAVGDLRAGVSKDYLVRFL